MTKNGVRVNYKMCKDTNTCACTHTHAYTERKLSSF